MEFECRNAAFVATFLAFSAFVANGPYFDFLFSFTSTINGKLTSTLAAVVRYYRFWKIERLRDVSIAVPCFSKIFNIKFYRCKYS